MSEIKMLHLKRGNLKASLKKFNQFLDKINLEDIDINMIRVRLEKIEPLWDVFEQCQSQIELIEPDNLDEAKERELFEESYFEVVSKARGFIENAIVYSGNAKNSPNVAGNEGDEAASMVTCSHENERSVVKLPKIELPSFDGNWEGFLSFQEEFQSLIGSRKDLEDVQKFRYLIKALKGDAAIVVKAMEVTSANYAQAWEALVARYDNKRQVVNKHVKAILDCQRIEKATQRSIQAKIDEISSHLRSLKSLGQPTDQWDALLEPIILRKMDAGTIQRWEQMCKKDRTPTTDELINFLQDRATILGALEEDKIVRNPVLDRTKIKSISTRNLHSNIAEKTVSAGVSCYYCHKPHKLYSCSLFRTLAVPNRLKEVQKLGLCANCFLKGHTAEKCSGLKCRVCAEAHNTLLHQGSEGKIDKEPKQSQNPINISRNALAYEFRLNKPVILLSTAMVHVLDQNKKVTECRVLLDSGSQSNFISERFAKLLDIPQTERKMAISGIGGAISGSLYEVKCSIKSRYSDFEKEMEFLVLPKITLPVPEKRINVTQFNIPKEIFLADPSFCNPGPIDALIGAEYFFSLLEGKQIALGADLPKLQLTVFGWVVAGKLNKSPSSEQEKINCGCALVDESLKKFWEIEEIPDKQILSPEEKRCEKIFEETTKQDATGRFIVNLPVKENIQELGESESMARRRFYQLERRLEKHSEVKKEYTAFMQEYLSMGHMEKVAQKETDKTTDLEYYMPHHCVINSNSSTTRLRVVFDASAKASSGQSLNDILLIGPKLQDDLFSIILRFRQHKYVITADITKMYRQIWVAKEQIGLQKILWRDNPSKPVEEFCLKTVTYGTAPASFLATRCLQQAVIQEKPDHCDLSRVILKDFYMDDLLTGADSIEVLANIQTEVIEVLRKVRFELHKWCSNDKKLLEKIPAESIEKKYIPEKGDTSIKTLGLWWNPDQDCFKFSINVPQGRELTKRKVLSEIARVFDPLGLLGPVIIKAKIFLQQLWKDKNDWDDKLTEEMHLEWSKYRLEMKVLEGLKIPRPIRSEWNHDLELHGFSDASEKAYGAVVYVKEMTGETHLVCAKSRVAPLKNLSLPRLELCGALILARLVKTVNESFRLNFKKQTLWCDSTILLAWLASPPGRWKTFVANRVSEIQDLAEECEWRHVRTEDNPADKISRGLYPSELLSDSLWWHGPPWLGQPEAWPIQSEIQSTELEERKAVSLVSVDITPLIEWERFSSYTKLVRTVWYVRRFINPKVKASTTISASEWVRAEKTILRLVHGECFSSDVKYLKRGQICPKSKIANLCPFLDEDGLLRVGGRLGSASIVVPFDQRHQYVLPAKHHVTKLIIEWEHKRHLHAGPQLLLAAVRQKYWPLRGRDIVRRIVHKCGRCFKANPKVARQRMGDLPAVRLQSERAFLYTGIDYCGPISIKAGSQRYAKKTKAYVAVFVCMTVKAVHLELVGDLSTEAFLAALKRFFARRGKARRIYSDNGSNFRGAEKELKEMFANATKDELVKNYLANEGIAWDFIPPYSPHFGGLWESSVKSFKFHFKRIIGEACLTYEEMITYMCLIESCLNSRPLLPLSSDPNDPTPLTPGHFLVGDALTAIPEPNIADTKITTLDRWHRVTQLFQHFWARWTREYISTLQLRTKWVKKEPNLKIGQLVLLKEERYPPLKWPLGRITEVFKGPDGLVRVVTVQTVAGAFKRPVCKVCLLPTSEELNTQEEDENDN